MRKVTLKIKGEYTPEGLKQNVVFTDTKENAGYIVGWSGEYTAVRVNGDQKFFTVLKQAKEYLAQQ